MFPSFPRVCSKDSEGSPGGRGKAPAQLVGQQHLQSPGPSCLTKLFSLNFLLKWVQRTCQRAAIAKLQIQSNPAIFLLSEKPYYLRWKKIPTLQECKCPRGGWCTSAPRAAELTPFCLISYPGRVTLSRGGWWWHWESPSNHHCTLQTHTQPAAIGQNPKPKLGLPGITQL